MTRTSFFVIATVGFAAGCLDLTGDCTNEVLAEVVSPDSTSRAVVFNRECGATTGSTTQVSIMPVGAALPDSSGNVFIADDDHGRAPSASHGGPRVDLRWATSDTLELRHHHLARVFTRETERSGVTVRFVVDSLNSK